MHHAFISYSHAADAAFAPALEAALQRFAKPWYKLRALNVFRDAANLNLSPGLWDSIVEALQASDYLLYLACPEAAASKWVNKEVEYWLAHKDPRRLLIIVTGGELVWDDGARDFDWSVTTCLPRSLSGAFTGEPLYLDCRWARTSAVAPGSALSLEHSRFRECVALLAATLRGLSVEDMIGEEVAQHRWTTRLRNAAIATLSVLLLAASAAAVIAFQQRAEALRQEAAANRQRMRAEASSLFNQTRANLEGGALADAVRAVRRLVRTYGADPSVLAAQQEVITHPTAVLATIREPLDSRPRVWLSPDGTRILSLATNASNSFAARVYDWGGAELSSLPEVYRAAFSPDGNGLVAAFPSSPRLEPEEDGSACGNDLRVDGAMTAVVDFAVVTVAHPADRQGLRVGFQELARDGRRLSVCGNVATIDDPGGVTLRKIRIPGLVSAAFTPGAGVLAATAERTFVYDAAGQPVIELPGATPAASPDGQRLATVQGTVTTVWDITGHAIARLEGVAPVVGPDGSVVTVVGKGSRLWRSGMGADLTLAFDGVDPRFSPDGRWVMTTVDGDRTRLALATGPELATIDGASGRFVPDRPVVLTATMSGIIRLWDIRRLSSVTPQAAAAAWQVDADTRTRLETFDTGPGCFFECVSPDGGMRASIGLMGVTPGAPPTAVLQVQTRGAAAGNSADWRPAATAASRCSGPVAPIVFAPSPARLTVLACGDGTVRTIDDAGAVTWEGRHGGAVNRAVFSRDGRFLLTASADRTVAVWDAATGARRQVYADHEAEVSSILEGPDGTLLATLTGRGTLRLWTFGNTEPMLLARMALDDDVVTGVAFSADGSLVLGRTRQGRWRRWLARPAQLEAEYRWLPD